MLFYKDGAELQPMGRFIHPAWSPGLFYEVMEFKVYQRTLEFKSDTWSKMRYMHKSWLFASSDRRQPSVVTIYATPVPWTCLLRRSL